MRKIAVLTFGLLVLQALPASAAPDAVRQKMCSDGAGVRLELTDTGDPEHPIKVRVEVYRSPPGHSWNFRLRHAHGGIPPLPRGVVFFEGTRVASESGGFVVQRRAPDRYGFDAFVAKATDTQAGQFCRASAGITE